MEIPFPYYGDKGWRKELHHERRFARRTHDYRSVQTSHLMRQIYGAGISEHYSSPFQHGTLSGLAQSDTQPIEQGIQAAANFVPIPGFSQIVGAVESILNSVFGWGDPTPIEDLYSKVIELRVQLAQVHHMTGVADDFHIPTGVTDNPNGGGWNVLALFIVNDYLHGVPSEHLIDDVDWNYEHVHGQELISHYNPEVRADLYKTIKLLGNEITLAVGDAQGAAPTTAAPGASSYSATQTAPAAPTNVPPTDQTATTQPAPAQASFAGFNPWLVAGGAGVVLLVILAATEKD